MAPKRHGELSVREQRQIKRDQNKATLQLARYAPHAIKQAVLEKNYDVALDGLHAAIKDGESWAILAFLQVADTLGRRADINIEIRHRLGVDETAALQAIGVVREAEQKSPEELSELFVRELLALTSAHPELKPLVIAGLAALFSSAEVA